MHARGKARTVRGSLLYGGSSVICKNCGNEVTPRKDFNLKVFAVASILGATPSLLYLIHFGRKTADICPVCGTKNDRPHLARPSEIVSGHPWYSCSECKTLSPPVPRDLMHKASTAYRSTSAPLSIKLAYLNTRRRLAKFAGCREEELHDAYLNFEGGELFRRLARDYRRLLLGTSGVEFGQASIIYLLVRAMKPETVVETGVGAGLSSAVILQALEENGRGNLHSIDLYEDAGRLIPEELRHRWRLSVGTSRELLSGILQDHGKVDLFFHDSYHTYENMSFEFESVDGHLVSGGVLASHDVGKGEGRLALDDFRANRDYRESLFYGDLGLLRKGGGKGPPLEKEGEQEDL